MTEEKRKTIASINIKYVSRLYSDKEQAASKLFKESLSHSKVFRQEIVYVKNVSSSINPSDWYVSNTDPSANVYWEAKIHSASIMDVSDTADIFWMAIMKKSKKPAKAAIICIWKYNESL